MVRVEIKVDDKKRVWIGEIADDPESELQAAKSIDDALSKARDILNRDSERDERQFAKGFRNVRGGKGVPE